MNDPFDGGIHLQDIFVFKPVFLDERADRLRDHDRAPRRRRRAAARARRACDNTEIFQEGIRLPWLRLYDRGEPVEAVFEVIRANVRIPRMTLGDLAAQVAATIGRRARAAGARRAATAPSGSRALMTGARSSTPSGSSAQEIARLARRHGDASPTTSTRTGSSGATCRSRRR